ncbi:long-chain-fatty-acid--CoA ligase [Halobacillus karajensis]|uniref:Long-chain-fatty-acid--CoA ligase n=1 Tax=Halobacillus karajensis TaxID=195088 RepID=A0A024P5E3_9BACI|nr:long-chain-fatty-acid--CoA ligase [Halobacillus karajensis]CDQ17838.1 Long-chain-fatty-acid--CoA ligase [Halobacillus karajensis]CDQ24244.1 Long-chain-fatty-acid--CoA ligase [Halobacillus karajensis]CDQ29507.1 Long-chain-fatty-acid--CoA ligase [Halobacillus karajensis]
MHVPLILTEFLDRAVQLYGDKPAVIDDHHTLTYGELNERVNQLSRGLRSLGVEKGDKVAYLAPNSTEMLEGFYGAFQVGAVMTPLNTRLKPEDYRFILEHSESKVLFVDYTLLPLVEEVVDEVKNINHVIVHGDASSNGYEAWLRKFSPHAFARESLEETDIASLLYTSGTTGNPKGVLLSHRSNYLHALSSMHHLKVSDQDTLLHVLPMFHVNGWGSPFYYTANGATQVMLRKTDPSFILEKVEKHQVSVLHMAPTVLNMVIESYEAKKPSIEQDVRVVIAGSAPPPAFVRKVEEGLNWKFIQVYGMTEISPLITTSELRSMDRERPVEEQYKLKAKAGYSMIGSQVKVVDDLGDEVPHDGKAVGEIVTRSNNVMEGYFKNEEATNEAIREGWLHTGDMAIVDEGGNIEIVDRKKDVIISGGENISSIEVEAVLYEHPSVLEAAVVAIPHEKWGEVPHAVVVLREEESLMEEEVIRFCREKLAHFKAPKSVSFIEELPKTASGKIQKVVLRKEFWKEHNRMVN